MSDVERVTLRRCPRIVRQTSSGKVSNEWQVPVPGDSDLCPACESAPFVPAAALDAAVRERDEARAERDERNLTIRQLRAEVERLCREWTVVERGRDVARAERDSWRRVCERLTAERDEARAEVERRGAAIRRHSARRKYPTDEDHRLWSVLIDDLPAGSRVGGAAVGDVDANPSGLRTDAPGGQPDPVARAVEARTREIAEWVRLGGHGVTADAIESRFLSGGDDA